MRTLRSSLATAAVAVTAVCAGTLGITSAQAADVTLPPADGQFDYQIGGPYTPASTVDIVDRDRGASPVAGKYNICYVNAFQTQPGEKGFWTGSHSDLLLRNDDGSYVEDAGWPGEYLLDISTDAKRQSLAGIVGGWIDGCGSKGFQAVEPDNLDSWTRSKGKLTQANALAFATLLAARAHTDGLAIAQKNTTQLGASGKNTAGLDFAIAEECQVNNECSAYTDVYGVDVIEIEYTDNGTDAYATACANQGQSISVILRDRNVVPAGDPAYHYESC